MPKSKFCTAHRKRAYKGRTSALVAAAKRARFIGKELRVYKCPVCRKWHMTSQTREEAKGKQKTRQH